MPNYNYNKDKIKSELTIDQVAELVSELHGEPIKNGNVLVCKTICHNSIQELDQASHKLYYYENTGLFHCYTGCSEPTFDIFDLVLRVKSHENPNYQLPQAIDFVARYFGYSSENNFEEESYLKEDLTYLEKYDRINNIKIETQEVELKEYNDTILKNLPKPVITPWIEDGISQDIMNYYEICYDPKNCGIVIPHRDINGRLVGIRERNLSEENIEKYGKYRPAYIAGKMYNHPLSFNLYGLYQNKENIRRIKKVFVFESEKAVMQYATMFGQENNIAVGVCGSSFINYQFWLLVGLGVQEVIIGLDKQFQELGDSEFKKLTHNLKNIHNKYGKYVTLSLLWDKENLLGYKDSPTDKDRDIFEELYKRRINLYV